MSNTLINSPYYSFKHSKTRDAAESMKAIVFSIGDVNLGLRIETVYKVLNQTQIYGSGLNGVGIAHVSDREVIVVDLHRHLCQPDTTNVAPERRYLVIAQNSVGELYGIPVTKVPFLMQVSLSNIRFLPQSYSQLDLLGFASHVCNITEIEPPLTIFMLDVERLLAVS